MKNFYDAIIIGFGKGGKTLAGKLGAAGKKVALIEKSNKMYGGTCINVGCIPSKSLVHSGAFSLSRGGDFNKKAELYKNAIDEKRRLTGALRQKNFDKLNTNPNITIIDGSASFISADTVKVTTENEVLELTAPKIYINTGSVSVEPKIDGIQNNPHIYYSNSIMELDTLPKHLAIIGGGYIGLEFASMYSNFGSQVTVLQDGTELIPREDRDIADAIKEILTAQGINFELGAAIKKVEQDGTVVYEKDGKDLKIDADAVLIATGRRPNTDSLNLSAANVQLNARGGIITDVNLKTTQNGIYAMGDVTGGLQFTYVSLDDYRVIASGIDGGDYTTDKRINVPYSVFMSVPYSRVGMNEKEAAAAGKNFRTVKMPAAQIPKAQVLKKPVGILKALIDTDTNKILGAMLLCEESYEVINTVKLAMDLNADYSVLKNQIFTHPTMSEALNDLFSL